MNTKQHIISAVLTFVSTFLVTFGGLLATIDTSHIDKVAILSILTSAITVALRAVLKEFTSSYANK